MIYEKECFECGDIFLTESEDSLFCSSCSNYNMSNEEKEFLSAIFNKDGPNSHPDSMFAMSCNEARF